MPLYTISMNGKRYKIRAENEQALDEAVQDIEAGTAEMPQNTQEPTEPNKEGLLNDIGKIGSEFNQGAVDRFKNINKPTVLGEVLGQKEGSIGGALAGTPERILRTAGAIGGTGVDAIDKGMDLSLKLANKMTGGIGGQIAGFITEPIGSGIGYLAKKTGADKLINKGKEAYEKMPESSKANWKTTGDLLKVLEALPVSKATEKVLKTGKKSIDKTVKGVNDVTGKTSENFSGVKEETLRAWSDKNQRKTIINEAGNKDQLAGEILEALEETAKSQTEKGMVHEALKKIPSISLDNTIKALEDAKYSSVYTDQAELINKKIDKQIERFKKIQKKEDTVYWIDDLKKNSLKPLNKNNKIEEFKALKGGQSQNLISAKEYYNARKQIDDMINGFGKDYGDISSMDKSLMKVRTAMKDDLLKASKETNYAPAIKDWHDNIEKAEELKKYLGRSEATREKNIEGFISNLTNKNKSGAQKALEKIDPDLAQRAKASSYADALGLKRGDISAPLFSRSTTGKSMAGVASLAGLGKGALTGNIPLALGSLMGVIGTSPRLASKTLGALTKAEGGLKKLSSPKYEEIRNLIKALSTAGVYSQVNSNKKEE